MAVCVYALTSAAMPPVDLLSGIGRERLRAVRVGAITAIVGTVRQLPPPDEHVLRRFDAIVRRLCAAVPALLPARFGSSFDTLDELASVLRLRQQTLRQALRAVRGRTQMTVRVIATGPGRLTPATVQDTAAGAGWSGTGADYLRGRAAAAARARQVPGFEAVRARVGRWVRAERIEHRAGVATIYHLVPRATATSYRTTVERTAAAAGIRCVVTGPWPPYAFADW